MRPRDKYKNYLKYKNLNKINKHIEYILNIYISK